MKVYNRKAFMALPDGTIFMKGARWYFNDLQVKHDTLFNDAGEPIDWVDTDLTMPASHDSGELSDRLEDMLANGESFPINTDAGRDGCFNDEDLFMVFEKGDLLTLGGYIDAALKVS